MMAANFLMNVSAGSATIRRSIFQSSLLLFSRQISDSNKLTTSPSWEKKMRLRFQQMDINKDGVFSDEDIRRLANQFTEYSGQASNYSHYYKTLGSVWSYGHIKGDKGSANIDQFVEGMKEFVTLPNAKEIVTNFCKVNFNLMDVDKDGVVTYDEFRQFHKEVVDMNEEMIGVLFAQTDTNKDGLIQLTECQDILQNFFFNHD